MSFLKLSQGTQRERAYSSMDYEAYQKTLIFSATPLMKPLDAPAVPPPIILEPEAVSPDTQSSDPESELVSRLLKDHILKQNVSAKQREIKSLKTELKVVRAEYDVLLEKYTEATATSPPVPAETLLEEALRCRSSSVV